MLPACAPENRPTLPRLATDRCYRDSPGTPRAAWRTGTPRATPARPPKVPGAQPKARPGAGFVKPLRADQQRDFEVGERRIVGIRALRLAKRAPAFLDIALVHGDGGGPLP